MNTVQWQYKNGINRNNWDVEPEDFEGVGDTFYTCSYMCPCCGSNLFKANTNGNIWINTPNGKENILSVFACFECQKMFSAMRAGAKLGDGEYYTVEGIDAFRKVFLEVESVGKKYRDLWIPQGGGNMVVFKLTGSQAKWVKENLPGFVQHLGHKSSMISTVLIQGYISLYQRSFTLIFSGEETTFGTICRVSTDNGVEWEVLEGLRFITTYAGIVNRNPGVCVETDSEYIVLKKTILRKF